MMKGIRRPKEEITMTEVHDCFSITELVTMEDLQLADEGKGVKDVLDGAFDAEGSNPCQIDGAEMLVILSALRVYACFTRIICSYRPGRRTPALRSRLGLNHNLGAFPHQNICSISIAGPYG